MTTPITAELNKERYCLVKPVDIPPIAEYSIRNGFLYQGGSSIRIPLPPGSWSIIGLGKDLSEAQWEGMVDKVLKLNEPVYYKIYTKDRDADGYYSAASTCATSSGLSWLKSLNADENYLILKQQP